ncbi:neuron navigator 3-like [Limulus polyphemus]|uniref:Neuron navigator 3-like n=1 Tax=Limulus polyphemus TaxID=6850 RepID=A0ABM1SZI7_LIMPO|nr:neuron navigator 3-like [Limulus polyphemus]
MPSMSTQGTASRSDAAVKNLTKRTPGGRNSSGVRQTISKPTSTGRKDVETSRIIQAKNANGSRIVNSSSLPRRGDSSGTGSLPRLKNNEGECGRSKVGNRTEAPSQNQRPSDEQGQLCKSIQPDNPIRQSKISSLIPKTERAIKTASSGSVGSFTDTGSVCSDGMMADSSVTDRGNAQVSAQETGNSGIPKPTAAVKGTSKPPKEETRHNNAATSNVTQSVPSSSGGYLSVPRPIMPQESHTPVKLSRDEIYVPIEINRQVLENRQLGSSRQHEDNGSTSSLPKSDRSITERTREGSQGTISVAKVSPIMNTNISNATKEKLPRQQDNVEERRPENSNVPLQASQTRRGSEDSQRESDPISDNCSRNSKSKDSKSVKSEVIPNAEMVTEIKSRRSAVKDVPKDTDGPSCDTEASFGEEADDVIVNIKPMQPITRASTYGYIRSLGPFPSTRNFANKLQSPGLRLLTDFSGTGGGRLGLSRQILTAGDSSRIYGIPMKRTFSTSKGVLDVDYSSDVDSVDLAAGYMSDGDVLRPGLVYRVDDIASGYMSEGGASLYGRKVSSKTKDSILSGRGAAPRTINVLQDDRSIKPCPLRPQYKSSLDDSSSISSGISDTIAEFSTDDNMTGSSVSSETNLYCSVKKTQRDELPSSCALPSSVSKEKSNSNRKGMGANSKGSSSGKSSNVKKTDSSMQTESSAFQQMSSAAWKKYLQQHQQEQSSQNEEVRSGHNRTRNVELESGKIRDKKSSSSGSSNKKNSVCNGSVERYNGGDGHKSRQKVLIARSEESKQRNLLDNEYPGEKLYRNGRSSSPKPSKTAPDMPSQGSRDMRKVQGSRPLAVSGPSMGHSIIKRPTSTSSVSSSGSVKSSGSRGYGKGSNTLDKMMEVTNSNECDSVGINRALFQTSNIPSNGAPSYQTECMPNNAGKGSERKTKVKVSANTQTNAQDLYMIGSSAHSDGEYNSLGRRSSAKNYALMSPTLSLRERVYGSNRPVLSGASTPSSDYVMLPGLHLSSKERSQHLPRFSSPLKHGDGDTGNYVTLDHPAVLSSLQSSSPSPYAWLRYSGGSTAGSVCSAPVTRGFNNGSLTEADSMESLSSLSSGVHGQGASRYMFPLSPVNPLTPSLCGSSSHSNIRGAAMPYMGGLLSKLSNKDDEMHGSSLSLVSTASSLYLTTDEKHAHEIRKLRRELEQANEKVATLTSQLTTNAHMVAAFEQSLSNMTGRLQHLTASAEQKDSELGELRNTIEALKKQSAEAGLTKMALQSMQAVQRTMQGKMSRQLSTDSVSSVNSQSSACSGTSGSSMRSDITGSKGKKKKKGWLRSSFSKAFSRSKKNKNGSVSDVEDLKHIQSDSSTPNSPLLGPHPMNGGIAGQSLKSSHSSSALYEKEERTPEIVKDLKKQLREKDMILTDIRLEALTSAHQLESLKDTVNKMKNEMMNLKQDNEQLQRLMVNKSLNSSQSSIPFRNSVESLEKRLSASEQSVAPSVDLYLNDAATDREGKRVTISTYLCCHGDYGKVALQAEPQQEVFIGSVSVSGKTKWDLLDNIVKRAFKEYVLRLDPISNLGLNAESVLSYHIGDIVRSKDAEVPDLLPCGYLIGDNMQIHITLKGAKQSSVDALAFETLIPKSIIQRYVSLLSEHRRIILCGPSGTGKTYLAQKLAEFLVFRSGKELSPGAVATFSVDHKSAKELRQYLSNVAEQCESSNGSDLPTVIILDNLHHVGSLGEVFNGFLSAKYQNCPYIIGTMNQATCSTTNLQLHHNFRWVLCANHMEPVKGFLGRFLHRKLVEIEVRSGTRNPDLIKIIDWMPKVWTHLNKFLETHSSSDVTIGPRLFLSCPIDVSSSQVWFTDLWNYSIVPYLMEAVREGLQLYGRRSPWEDPTEWVQESYPWLSIGEPDWPQLLRLRPEDVGYEGYPIPSVGAKKTPTSHSEVEADPLLNMLMRLQEAASYSSPHNNDTEGTDVDSSRLRTEDLLNTGLESTL